MRETEGLGQSLGTSRTNINVAIDRMNKYIKQAEEYSDDPLAQWEWALDQRRRNDAQELANAEHYLWNRFYAQEGPREAAAAFITPFGYYGAKKLGLLSGRSEANLGQLKAGLLGAWDAF